MSDSASTNDGKPASPVHFDQLVLSLRQIVEKLEGGQLGLEEALRAFEDGVRLSRQAAQVLDQAEHRVEVLLRDPQSGEVGEKPFAG